MEDLRKQDVDFVATFVKTHDSYILAINEQSYRLTEKQFNDLHNAITTALSERLVEVKGL